MNLTDQEIFDQACRHLANQKRQSSCCGYCKYRGPRGTKCIVGIFISDEEYNPDWDIDGITVERFEDCDERYRPAILQGASPERIAFLKDMQNAHDASFSLDALKANLFRVAYSYGLIDALVDTIAEWNCSDETHS